MDPKQKAAMIRAVAKALKADPDILIAWDTFDKLDTRTASTAVAAIEKQIDQQLKKAS